MKQATIRDLKEVESTLEDVSLKDETLTEDERKELEAAIEALRNLLEGTW